MINNENDFYRAINKIKDMIQPDSAELANIQKEIKRLVNILSVPDESLGYIPIEIEPHGSTGIKQTQLKNDSDIDLFIGFNVDPKYLPSGFKWDKKVQFPLDDQKEFFRMISEKVVMPRLKQNNYSDVILSYAEHPYVSANVGDLQIDIVGYFCIPESYLFNFGPITAVDRTPFHSKYVVKHATEQIRNDIRVMKYFMKRSQAYGEKSIIGQSGFIGYALELLMIYFGNIKEFCMRFDELDKLIICTHDSHDQSFKSNPRYSTDFLFIMDPVDKFRNVGSSIDPLAYYHIRDKLSAFMDNPDLKYFEDSIPSTIDLNNEPIESLKNYYYFETRDPNKCHFTIIRDKLGSLGNRLKKMSHNKDFLIDFENVRFETICDEENDLNSLLVYVDNPQLSSMTSMEGPRVLPDGKNKENVDRFTKKHGENVTRVKNTLYAKVPRKITDFQEYFDKIITQYFDPNYEVVSQGNLYTAISSGKTVSKNIQALYYVISKVYLANNYPA